VIATRPPAAVGVGAQARFVLGQRAMLSLHARKSWPLTFSALGFLPFIGLFPKHCSDPGASGHAGSAGSVSSAGETGQGGSAGASDSAGAGGDAPTHDDLVTEPLLGCVTGVSGKTTPGVFQALPYPNYEALAPDYPWITDWSGDGQTAVGYYTNEPFDDAYGAFFIRWRNGQGYDIEVKARIELSRFNEKQAAKVSCDGSVQAWLLGDGSYSTTNNLQGDYDPDAPVYLHENLALSEDGSSLVFLTGIPNFKRWTEWHSTKGDVASLLIDPPQSISWDGLTVFGTSYCYYVTCESPKTYRWQPPQGGEDVTTTAPTPYVAADGQSIVFASDASHIGIWRDGAVESIDCLGPCQALAWSSRAQVLLVDRDGDSALWTRPHGFRPLSSLLAIPSEWTIAATGLSLDGWTVTGTASSAETPFAYFRATLEADAFQ
jgi:hypothetical protein